jgi:hypothetical protein
MSNWYTIEEASALFRPPLTGKTIRVHVRTVRESSNDYADKIRMEYRGGKQVQTVSTPFLVDLASKKGRIFVDSSEPVQSVEGTFEPSGSVDARSNAKRTIRTGLNVDALIAEKDAHIAALQEALQREKETVDREREIARKAQESLEREQKIRMAGTLERIAVPVDRTPVDGSNMVGTVRTSLPPDRAESDATPKEGEVPAKKRPWWQWWLVE